MPSELFSKRLLVVTGKGGVGKSTVSAALALAAAARGKRVLVCEVAARERLPALLGGEPAGPEISEAAPGVFSVHVLPPDAMREYALMVLRYKAIYKAVFENRLVRYFLRAVPSLAEIVMLGKVWWHAARDERFDLVILDAPATGHAVSLLATPANMLQIVSDGPLARDMREMQALLTDPARTSVCLVALPEEMPVNEAIELDAQLGGTLALPRGPVFLNAFNETRFTPGELAALEGGGARLAAAAAVAREYEDRADICLHAEDKLRVELRRQPLRLPMLYAQDFGPRQVQLIARVLAEGLAASEGIAS